MSRKITKVSGKTERFLESSYLGRSPNDMVISIKQPKHKKKMRSQLYGFNRRPK